MTSPLLALFTRSMRDDTRVKSTYWARAGLAAFMLVVMGMAAFARATGGAPGLVFLQSATWLQVVFLTISGLGYFASAITDEKEEETLGLLRMTNLSPLSILLGKSTSRLLGALLLVASQVPFTLMAVTLGGVSSGQVFAAYATLAAYTFLLCNLALLASVIARRTGGAALLTGAVLAAGWIGGFFSSALAGLSPFRRLAQIFTTGFHEPAIGWQVTGSLAVGVACFLVAWGAFERLCAGRADSGPGVETVLRRRFRRWLTPGRPPAFRALAWKDFHFLHGGRVAMIAKSAGAVLVVLGALAWQVSTWGRQAAAAFPGQVILFSMVWLVAEAGFAASRICASEVRERTLSSLALLPQDLLYTMGAKVGGCWRALIPAWTLFALSVVSAFLLAISGMGGELMSIIIFGGVAFGYVFAMSYFGVYLTAYLSLRMKRGALPLAIIICLASSVLAAIPLLGWYGVPILAVLFGHKLRGKILMRLEEAAAEN